MRYRKKPVIIDAIQFNGHNQSEVISFTENKAITMPIIEGVIPAIKIETLEGIMFASKDDWIIKGVNGEFYPCKPDIFAKTYEPVL